MENTRIVSFRVGMGIISFAIIMTPILGKKKNLFGIFFNAEGILNSFGSIA
jgi:hypothetical protein